MKSAAPLLLLLPLFFCACKSNQLTTRRGDLYSPAKPSGPFSEGLKEGTWQKGIKPPTYRQPTPEEAATAAADAAAAAAANAAINGTR